MMQAISQSMNALSTSMVDLMLLHAPGDPQTREETWRALEDAHYEVIICFQSNHPMSPAVLLAADVRRC